jgi:hypothetical protein
MKINKKNIQTLFLTVFVTLVFFASCFNINFLSQNSVEYGYLSVNPQSERALDKPRIVKADITISSEYQLGKIALLQLKLNNWIIQILQKLTV